MPLGSSSGVGWESVDAGGDAAGGFSEPSAAFLESIWCKACTTPVTKLGGELAVRLDSRSAGAEGAVEEVEGTEGAGTEELEDLLVALSPGPRSLLEAWEEAVALGLEARCPLASLSRLLSCRREDGSRPPVGTNEPGKGKSTNSCIFIPPPNSISKGLNNEWVSKDIVISGLPASGSSYGKLERKSPIVRRALPQCDNSLPVV
jgi:hypothetical protein